MRKVFAIAAAPGLAAGISIFVASFFGLTMDRLGLPAILLHLGVFALALPLAAIDRPLKGSTMFEGKPRWAVRSIQILGLLFIVIFFTFLALSHTASPQIIDGQYVLKGHGAIPVPISEKDYLFLKPGNCVFSRRAGFSSTML